MGGREFATEASRTSSHRVPRRLLTRMTLSIAIEFAQGVVPVLGDVLDVVWKANLRKVGLLDRHLRGSKWDDISRRDGGDY
jgi:hypothetical protein